MDHPHKKHAVYGLYLGIGSLAVVSLIAFIVLSKNKAQIATNTAKSKQTTETTKSGLATKAFDGKFAAFQINPPSGWTVDRNVPTIHVNFINPQPDTDAIGPFKANMNVATQVANGVSLEEFVQTTKKAQQSSLINYREVTDRPVSLGGVPGRIIESTFLINNRQLHTAQLVAIKGANAYIVTGTTLDTSWSKYQKLFSDSMLTLSLQKL